jgi:hypothetical protein
MDFMTLIAAMSVTWIFLTLMLPMSPRTGMHCINDMHSEHWSPIMKIPRDGGRRMHPALVARIHVTRPATAPRPHSLSHPKQDTNSGR